MVELKRPNVKIDYSRLVFTPEEQKLIKMEIDIVKHRYPHHVPILIRCKDFEIEKVKYLVPKDLKIGQFLNMLRSKIKINSYESVFMLIKNTIPVNTSMFYEVYNDLYDINTSLLIIDVCKEKTFG